MLNDLFADATERAPRQNTVERLFFGLMLPGAQATAAVDVLERVRTEHGLNGSRIRADRLHVTLIHVGDYPNTLPASVVPALRMAGDSLTEPAFEVAFDRAASFSGAPGRHPLVLLGGEGVEALKAFRANMLKAVIRHGVRPLSRQAFTPHITLSYADHRLPERPIRPITWRPEEIVLIHSEVGRSVYHTLGRWPLR